MTSTPAIDALLKSAHYDQSWHEWLAHALTKMDQTYLQRLNQEETWLPGPTKIFNAFTLPKDQVQYILFGESPYPRAASANGYAFWDQAVTNIWSDNGLSKAINKATSLRNMIKMLLVSRKSLTIEDTGQQAIANLDKTMLITHLDDLFQHLLDRGFLLLNASPVLSSLPVSKEAKIWQPFINELVKLLAGPLRDAQLVLFGKIADTMTKMSVPPQNIILRSEHPYNISFIKNKDVLNFFKPLNLLDRD